MAFDEQILRLIVAMVVGSVIGFERELRDKAAGLRTHILVAVGSATYMIIAGEIVATAQNPGEDDVLRIDPMRAVEGLIGGIGFLGAGAIIQERRKIRGMTTAANLWMTAALGASAGLGFFRATILALGAVFLIMVPVRYIELRLHPERRRGGRASEESPEDEEDEWHL